MPLRPLRRTAAATVAGLLAAGTALTTIAFATSAGAASRPAAAPAALANLRVAPYVDMGSWPTPNLTQIAQQTGLRAYSLGFVTGAGCKASWFNAYDPRQGWEKSDITSLRALGGDVTVSFGGASGIELAQGCGDATSLQREYQAVVSAYGLKHIDLDIEGAAVADPASIARRSQALAKLQKANSGLKISLTLPVLPSGLTSDGLNVVRSARDAGVNLEVVNVMAMDYYQSGDYGTFALQAAKNTEAQLKTLYPSKSSSALWAMVGVTPMLGQNDDGHLYNQAAAKKLVADAKSRHYGRLAFWELTRDRNACDGALYQCTNIPQKPYEFTGIFRGFTG
ncbi:MAG: chitinase [Mycobacteriales bacterium]